MHRRFVNPPPPPPSLSRQTNKATPLAVRPSEVIPPTISLLPFGGVDTGVPGGFKFSKVAVPDKRFHISNRPNFDTKSSDEISFEDFTKIQQIKEYMKNDRINNRNNPKLYPRKVTVDGTGDFRIIEVIPDGRCLFASIWLLTRRDDTIRGLLNDDHYTRLENFIASGLNTYIKQTLNPSKITLCAFLKFMHSYYVLNHSSEGSEEFNNLVDYDKVVEPNYCETPETENEYRENLLHIVSSLSIDQKNLFIALLKSYYVPSTTKNIESYAEADLNLLGDILSDQLDVIINVVETLTDNYTPPYHISTTIKGKNSERKKNIYLFFKKSDRNSGHFQAMVPLSILPNSSGKDSVSSLAAAPLSLSSDTSTQLNALVAVVKPREDLNIQSPTEYFAQHGPPPVPPPVPTTPAFKELFDECVEQKKELSEYFTFPNKLKIRYVSPNNSIPTDLPSTGFFGSNKASTTDRIRGEEPNTDNVYSKVSKIFTNPDIKKVEVYNVNRRIQTPETYKSAKEDWYFLVTLGKEPTKGGRTRKRHPKGGRMRSQKKRKMRTRGRRTKRRRFSQTKRQKR